MDRIQILQKIRLCAGHGCFGSGGSAHLVKWAPEHMDSRGVQAGVKGYQKVNRVASEIQGIHTLIVNHSAIVLFGQSESVNLADRWLITYT